MERDLRCHFAPSASGEDREVNEVNGVGSEVDVGEAPGVCSEVEAVPFADGGSDGPPPRNSEVFTASW